jgi:hypothetical protein
MAAECVIVIWARRDLHDDREVMVEYGEYIEGSIGCFSSVEQFRLPCTIKREPGAAG